MGSFSKAVSGAMQIVKQYPIHKCGHERHSISGTKCLQSMVGKTNSSRYGNRIFVSGSLNVMNIV